MKPLTIGAVRNLASHCSMAHASALKLTAARVTSRSTIITAPMTTMTRPAVLGADQRRPVQQLRLVEQPEQLGRVGDGDGLGVAA